MEEESATVLMPTDVKKYMKFAGRNLYFTPAEVDELKKFGPPGFSVIAFKPLKYLKKKFYIRPAQFIYPDESNIKGSTKLFIALLSKCLEKEVMAICRYIPRENISPKLVALVPQEEELNELLQVTPNGFHVIFLPFADDFRTALPLAREHSVADEEMIAKAKVRYSVDCTVANISKVVTRFAKRRFVNCSIRLKNLSCLCQML